MNNGQNIPQGYKKTTIGFIPQGWEIKRLKTIVTPIKTFSYSRDKLSDNVQTLIYIHYGDIHKSGEKYSVNLNVDRLPYLMDGILSENQISANDFPKLQSGDILLPDASEDYDGIGHAWELQNVGQQNVIGGLHTIAIRPNPQFVLLGYGSLMFYSWPVSKALKRIAQGTKVYSISFNLIDNIKILLPPLKEQQKIAEVLGTWDKAIEKQTQLIKKLELRKKGLMQQLLTGKKRLPGFNGEWRKVKLGKLFIERNEINKANLPLLSITADRGVIFQSESEKRDISNDDKSKYKHICPNDIGYNTMRMWQGRCALSSLEGIVSPAYTIITPNKDINPYYMEMLFKQPFTIYCFWTHSQGLVNDTLNCKFPDFSQIKVTIPNFEEQNAISQFFKGINHEIELCTQKLNSLLLQKKGLMQVLLTGKKRVI